MPSLAAAYDVTERLWWRIGARQILILVAVLTVVRFFVAANAGLLWDEPYYWMWSQHLAGGYYDHPPMVAWWIRAGTTVLGDGPAGIRFLFVLNTAATSFAAYAIGRALFDERIAWLSVLWTNVGPLIGIAGFMATPDGPSVLFWTLAVAAYAMVVRTERGAWWLAVGAMAGLGLLSKYTNFFLGLGIVLSLLLDTRLRRWFASPWLWGGGLLAGAIFLPVVLWNAGNGWVSFGFQFGRLGEARFTPVYLLTLLVVQPFIFNPYAFVFLIRGIRLWYARATCGREIGVLFATTIPAIVFIVFQSMHGEVLQHWLAPVFPTLTVIAVAAASTLPATDRLLRRLRTDAVPLALIAAVVVWAYALLPVGWFYTGFDPLNAIRGWPAYATQIEGQRAANGATWIATADYATTAELAYELRDRAIVVPVTESYRYGFLPPADQALLSRPGLLVIAGNAGDSTTECFGTLTDLGIVGRREGSKVLQTSRVYLVEDAGSAAMARDCSR